MEAWLYDLRHAARRLRCRPIASLVAILTLSLGIGATSTMYVLFKTATDDLPHVPVADRLARLWIADRTLLERRLLPSERELRGWMDAPPSGVRVAALADGEVTIEPGRAVNIQYVSTNFFELLASRPELGRTFSANEPGIVVSSRLWTNLTLENRRIGATLVVDGRERRLTGVMPRGFGFPGVGADAWLPIADEPGREATLMIARLDPGITPERASAMLSPPVEAARGKGWFASVVLLTADSQKRSTTMWMMLVAPALLVFGAVCANVAMLLVGDMRRRQQELAIRVAIGAGRIRMAQEAIADAVVIGAASGLAAILGASWSLDWARATFTPVAPDFAQLIPSSWTVWPFALGGVLAAIIGVGWLPALHASRTAVGPSTYGRAGGRPFRRGHYSAADLLLVLQIGVAATLVLTSTWLSHVFDDVRAIPTHVPTERIWAVPVRAATDGPLGADLPRVLLSATSSATGIESAAVEESVGGRRMWNARSAAGVGRCAAAWTRVSGGFFDLHHFPIRGILPQPGGVLLNDAAAERCGNPFELGEYQGTTPSLHVVGSVNDRVFGDRIPFTIGGAVVYTPLTRPEGRQLLLLVRTTTVTGNEAKALRDDLARQIRDVRFGDPTALAAGLEQRFGATRVVERILAALSFLGLILGIVGLNGAIAQALAARTREIAVRIALGARPIHVLAVTVGHHAIAAAVGVACGSGLSAAGVLMLSTDDAAFIRRLILLTISTPIWWVGLTGLLIVAVVLSTVAPVARALRLDPAEILRNE